MYIYTERESEREKEHRTYVSCADKYGHDDLQRFAHGKRALPLVMYIPFPQAYSAQVNLKIVTNGIEQHIASNSATEEINSYP
jgi:hypothetical protein